jgi:hypothetical protein
VCCQRTSDPSTQPMLLFSLLVVLTVVPAGDLTKKPNKYLIYFPY